MVYLRAVTPALCQLMDAAAESSTATTAISAFIEQRLRSLAHTQTPSQLDNALWVYLISQEQLFLRAQEQVENNERAPVSIPASLQLPSSITNVQDAVRWYCDELDLSTESPSPADGVHKANESGAIENQSTQSTPPPPKRSLLFSDALSRRHDKAQHTSARLEELLRYRYQPANAGAVTTPSDTSRTTTISSSADVTSGEKTQKLSTGPLATLRLALEALSNSKRAAALRQPRSLALVVRDLAALWSTVYLCKHLRRYQLRKERLLTGAEPTAATSAFNFSPHSASRVPFNTAASTAARASVEEPIAVCVHDYDLLLPWDLVCTVLTDSKINDAGTCGAEETMGKKKSGRAPLTMATVAARCRHIERQNHNDNNYRSNSMMSPISLIINPAVTHIEDNPDRLRKNARIDAIDEAANKYYYSLLTTRAHGQSVSASRGFQTNAATASLSSSAAAAAAHQEAVRSSLAAVELEDYGVLDPSRMRATGLSTLSGTVRNTRHRNGRNAGADVTAEQSAKSYAMFLRDASIGFDIQIMALTGAGVGYYMGYLRGLPTEWCTLYAVVGLVTMMLVDAVLIMIRMGRQDDAVLRARKRIQRQREKLEREGEKLVEAMQRATATSTSELQEDKDQVDSKSNNTQNEEGETQAASPAREVDSYTKKRQ